MNITVLMLSCIALVLTTLLISFTGHILHGSYIFNRQAPWYRLWQWQYNRIEYMVMRFLYWLGGRKIMRKSRFLRMFIVQLVSLGANGEVYTLGECLQIVDALFARYPNVYVGLRICPCRQAREKFDDPLPKLTDLTFIFSDTPGKGHHIAFNTFISLPRAKQLLRKLDQLGYVHTMFGACAQLVDGSVSVAICNCLRNICIPMDMALDFDASIYQKTHNVAEVNPARCVGPQECGKCQELCHFHARVKDPRTGKMQVLTDKCLGCALCVTHCPNHANRMRFLPQNKIIFYQNLFRNIRKRAKTQPIYHCPPRPDSSPAAKALE